MECYRQPSADSVAWRRAIAGGAAFFLVAGAAAPSAGAQDFADTQVLTNNAVFAAQDAAAQRKAREQRQLEELGQRAERQDALLQAQATSVRQLQGELQSIRDERQVIELGEAFDGSLQAGRWTDARSLLANSVAVDVTGFSETPGAPEPADTLVADLTRGLSRTSVLPRSHQHADVQADSATVTSDGYAWDQIGRSKSPLARRFGHYEYRFERSAEGWQLDAVSFRELASTP